MPRPVTSALPFAPPTVLAPDTLGVVEERGRSFPTPALVACGALDRRGKAERWTTLGYLPRSSFERARKVVVPRGQASNVLRERRHGGGHVPKLVREHPGSERQVLKLPRGCRHAEGQLPKLLRECRHP
jgi:hypothetical protein